MDPQKLAKAFLDAAVKLKLDRAVELAFVIVMGILILASSHFAKNEPVNLSLQVLGFGLMLVGALAWGVRIFKQSFAAPDEKKPTRTRAPKPTAPKLPTPTPAPPASSQRPQPVPAPLPGQGTE